MRRPCGKDGRNCIVLQQKKKLPPSSSLKAPGGKCKPQTRVCSFTTKFSLRIALTQATCRSGSLSLLGKRKDVSSRVLRLWQSGTQQKFTIPESSFTFTNQSPPQLCSSRATPTVRMVLLDFALLNPSHGRGSGFHGCPPDAIFLWRRTARAPVVN